MDKKSTLQMEREANADRIWLKAALNRLPERIGAGYRELVEEHLARIDDMDDEERAAITARLDAATAHLQPVRKRRGGRNRQEKGGTDRSVGASE